VNIMYQLCCREEKEKGKGPATRVQVRLYISARYLGTYTAG
jgi:hypothetical protein